MSIPKACYRAFEKYGREQKLDMSSGVFGELLNAETRKHWYAFNRGWHHSAVFAKKRRPINAAAIEKKLAKLFREVAP